MATTTTRLVLRKPADADDVDVDADIGANMDKIDAAIGSTICTSGTRPGTPFQGQKILETDTAREYVWTGSVWLQTSGPLATVPLTDVATVALNAAAGKVFKLSAAGNRTILTPTGSPVDGQGLIIAHTASGGVRTLALTTGSAGAFAFGTDITALTATGATLTDYIGCIYESTAARWRVVSYAKGY